jgi:hypothetical protein
MIATRKEFGEGFREGGEKTGGAQGLSVCFLRVVVAECFSGVYGCELSISYIQIIAKFTKETIKSMFYAKQTSSAAGQTSSPRS